MSPSVVVGLGAVGLVEAGRAGRAGMNNLSWSLTYFTLSSFIAAYFMYSHNHTDICNVFGVQQ